MALSVYLLRHGRAEAGGSKADADRALTEEGQAEVQAAARALGLQGVTFDWGLSSPLLRAKQTAELVWKELGLSAPLETVKALACGAAPAAVVAEIARVADDGAVLVVGHMPDLVHVAGYLLRPDGGSIAGFVPGAMIRIDFANGARKGAGRLEWMRSPSEIATSSR
ncbi:MAG: phosphohistidine phosphatase SixA [Myxococcota bacterium]